MVTHAGVATQIIGAIHGVSCARWELFRPGNASISLLEWGGASRRVISFDDRLHLDGTIYRPTPHPLAG